MTSEELTLLREQLAAIEHERWADWQRHLHARCAVGTDGTRTIPADLVARWERQIATAYGDLTEPEKQSDRDQVDRYWPLITDVLRRSAVIYDVPRAGHADRTTDFR